MPKFTSAMSAAASEEMTEMLALCWKWFCHLAKRGKDARQFPSVLARFAARAVRSGRRLCGQQSANEVMNERTQEQRGFRVEALPSSTSTSHEDLYATADGQKRLDTFEERLHDNTLTPILDQVAFRCDFPAWLATRTERDQRLIGDMTGDERTTDLARKYGVCPGRVSQLRREYQDDWQHFCAEPAEAADSTWLLA